MRCLSRFSGIVIFWVLESTAKQSVLGDNRQKYEILLLQLDTGAFEMSQGQCYLRLSEQRSGMANLKWLNTAMASHDGHKAGKARGIGSAVIARGPSNYVLQCSPSVTQT